MTTTIHDGGLYPPPDPEMPCCMAAMHSDGAECTCWTPIYSENRQVPKEGPSEVRSKCCDDCAYRTGSPEREADDDAVPEFNRREPFFCHQGIAYVVGLVHPSRAVRGGDRADYAPRRVADRVFQSSGDPGILCAGWAARNWYPRGPRP